MGSRIHICLTLILLFFVVNIKSDVSTSHSNIYISDDTVLLPQDNRVSYTIEASNGCFEWSTTVPGILDIEVVDQTTCENKISVKMKKGATKNSEEKISTWLLAKDKISHKTLRCEVLFEQISRIELISTTKNLSVGDTRSFSVEGFDKEGNRFSTLKGLAFNWGVTSDKAENNVVQFILFRDQSIESSMTLLKMEERGYRTSVILIKAINVGIAKVSARLSEPIYSHVKEHSINLFVFESLALLPENVIYMTPYSSLTFQLFSLKNELLSKIETPNLSYKWSTSNTAISKAEDSGLIQLQSTGETVVKATLTIMEDNFVACTIKVVEPAYLSVRIIDMSNINKTMDTRTNLISGREYAVDVVLKDKDGNPIYQTKDVNFNMKFDSEFFKTSSISSNNDHLETIPIKEGTTDLVVTLISIGDPKLGKYKFSKSLKFTEKITIVSPVSIKAKRVINLPYDSRFDYTYQLIGKGGFEMFQWSSSVESVATVNNDGVVSSHQCGTSVISSKDRILFDNQDQVNVSVSVPDRLEFVGGVKEVEIGKKFFVGVSLFNKNNEPYDNCTSNSFRWDISTQDIDQLSETVACPNNTNMCACVYLKATREGQSKLSVSYTFIKNDLLHTLSGSTLISTFKPYSLTQSKISLTYGSSVELTISDGPQPWSYSQILTPVLHPEDPSQMLIEDKSSFNKPGLWRYKITCLKYGEQKITIRIGDETRTGKTDTQYVVSFSCQEPKTILFIPKTPKLSEQLSNDPEVLVTGENVPLLCSYHDIFDTDHDLSQEDLKLLPTQFKLRNNRVISGFIKVYDAQGRIFNDFSSLDIDVQSNDEKLLSFINGDETNAIKKMKLADLEGFAKVSVTIRGFKKEVVDSLPKSKKPLLPTISSDFEIMVSNNLRMSPSKMVLFNHRKNHAIIHTTGGSGYNHIRLSDKSLARLEFSPGKNEIALYPYKSGIVRVIAQDVCLGGSETQTSVVYISDVNSIKLRCRDMIRVGEQTTVTIELLDIHDNVFDISQYNYMDFRLHVDGNSVEITPQGINSDDPTRKFNQITPSSRYLVVGKSIGMSSLSISILNPMTGKTVSSTPVQIHVYSHIKIFPRKVDLIPGASFQLTTIGGPPFRSEIVYSTRQTDIIDVKNDGLIIAKETLGKVDVFVTASVRGLRSSSQRKDENIHAGQDSIDVEVKEVSEIVIHASTTRIIQGEDIVIRVMGSNMESPFTFGNVDLQYKWDVSNPEILSIHSIHKKNVNDGEERGFSIAVRAISPGKTRVNVIVIAGPSYLIAKKASIAFEVVVPLIFLHDNPHNTKSELLISPSSRHSIRSNLAADYSLMEDESKSILILDQKSKQVISKGVAGTSIVAVKERRDQQTSLIRVTVKSPHHLELRPRFSESANLPVGSTLDYDIVLKDELGRQFDSYDRIDFNTFLNKHDIINVQILKSNESDYKQVVRVKAIRPGEVILQTRLILSSNLQSKADEHSSLNYQHNLEDYQLIKVSNAIFPVNPVIHIGGTVHFKTTFVPIKQMYQRVWFTGDPNVARIDPDTGFTTCISPGQTNIYHDSNVFTLTTIKCVRINTIETSECVKNSIFVNETQSEVPLCEISLRFFDSDKTKISDSPEISQNIIGHCVPKDTSLSSKFMKTESGKYVCEVTTDNKKYIDHDLYYQISSITIDVSDVNKTYIKKQTTGILVKEDFSIRGKKEIFLTPYKASDILEVRTSVPLSIKIRDPSLVSLYEISSDPDTEITRYEIKSKVKHHQYTTILTFESLKSMRSEEVLIIFREIGDDIAIPETEDSQGYQVLWFTIIMAILSIVVTFIYTKFSSREIIQSSSIPRQGVPSASTPRR